MKKIEHQFPPKIEPLFKPKRFKVIYGGRASGKSWSVARMLIILGTSKKMRILCTRELQMSIRESVHKLLSDTIDAMELSAFYEVEQSTPQ